MTQQIEQLYSIFRKKGVLTTDSRTISDGCIFAALKGEHFDGNDFALKVAEQGIAAAVIADRDDIPNHPRIFKVENTLTALQQLANLHRKTLKTPIIGITGTNGKTTTKELISAVLKKKFDIINTEGNFNNHLGVPLTLLRIQIKTQLAVIEMGANHPGEIKELCEIVEPDYGIITNIGKAHLEGFGDFQGVVNTKKALYDYLRENDGTAIVNGANPLLTALSDEIKRVCYNQEKSSATSDPYLTVTLNGLQIKTQLVGEYNFENVMTAVAVGRLFGVNNADIKDAIEAYKPTNNRSQIIKTPHNELIMDAYNANPTSMDAAVRNFAKIRKEHPMLIIGDMRELGDESQSEHRKIISLVEECGFKEVFLVGKEMTSAAEGRFTTFENTDELCDFLKTHRVTDKHILIKGSRGIRLEKVLEYL